MTAKDLIRLVTLSALWGASFLFMRVAAPVLGALPTAFFRTLLAAASLAVILFVLRTVWRWDAQTRGAMMVGVVNSAVPFAMYAFAAKHLPAGYSAILNATTPLMGVLVGAAVVGETLTLRKLAGVAIGMAGVAVLTQAGPVAVTPLVLLAAGACLVATFCYGMAGFLTRRLTAGLDSKQVALFSQVGASIVLAPLFALNMPAGDAGSWGNPTVWGAMATLGIVCTGLAYILYFRLIADIGPVKSLTVTFLIPLFGVLWGALFLREELSWAHAAGGALIAAALWLVLRTPKPAALPPAAREQA
ncbi:MAG: DMT family transporter [Burkholderiaceae bacterium]